MADIGYQDGIDAFEEWFRRLSIAIDEHNIAITQHNQAVTTYNSWVTSGMVGAPPKFPALKKLPPIPLEGPLFKESDRNTWPWPRKFFANTMRKLKDFHDGFVGEPPPPPPDEEPPPATDWRYGIAPRTYNYAPSNNSDPIFCKHSPGVKVNPDGSFEDKYSRYDTNGRDRDGGRDRLRRVAGLNDADNTNGLDPCALYNGMTRWPDDSYKR